MTSYSRMKIIIIIVCLVEVGLVMYIENINYIKLLFSTDAQRDETRNAYTPDTNKTFFNPKREYNQFKDNKENVLYWSDRIEKLMPKGRCNCNCSSNTMLVLSHGTNLGELLLIF